MKIKEYIKESYTELVHKVTWPSWDDLQNSAVLVMTTALILSLIIAGVDFVFGRAMEFVYSLLY